MLDRKLRMVRCIAKRLEIQKLVQSNSTLNTVKTANEEPIYFAQPKQLVKNCSFPRVLRTPLPQGED
jgi:hypothetical protein